MAVRVAVGALPQPVLDRVYELSAGNPLFAIELARSRHADDGLRAATPGTLRSTLAARIGDVTADQLTVLRTAAALGPTTLLTLATACDLPGDASLIADALEQELLVGGEDGLIRFAHPLLASVILDGTNPIERMTLHARLADVVADPDARARHLALSCGRQDAAVAGELEAAAERAAGSARSPSPPSSPPTASGSRRPPTPRRAVAARSPRPATALRPVSRTGRSP